MIKRIGDYSSMPEEDFNKIAQAVKKAESKKLFNVYKTFEDAKIASSELKIRGISTKIQKTANGFSVISLEQENVSFEEAQKSGMFKKIAFGRYSFQKESEIGKLFSYNFNDGSIWRLSTDSIGNQILIKEVEDEDEDDPIRINNEKREIHASLKKDYNYITDSSFKNTAQFLIPNMIKDGFINKLSTRAKKEFYSILNDEVDCIIEKRLEKLSISDKKMSTKIKKLVSTAFSMGLNSLDNLEEIIRDAVREEINSIGKIKNNF